MLIPLTGLKASIELFEKEVEIYPIWLCPFKLAAQPGMLRCPADKEEMCVDVGVYGVPRNPNFQAEATTRYLLYYTKLFIACIILLLSPGGWRSL